MPTRSWSLAAEVNGLELALRGTVVLLEQITENRDDPGTVVEIAGAAAALLGLLHGRVRDLGVVLHADHPADVAELVGRLRGPENAVDPRHSRHAAIVGGGDVLFTPGARPRSRRTPGPR